MKRRKEKQNKMKQILNLIQIFVVLFGEEKKNLENYATKYENRSISILNCGKLATLFVVKLPRGEYRLFRRQKQSSVNSRSVLLKSF